MAPSSKRVMNALVVRLIKSTLSLLVQRQFPAETTPWMLNLLVGSYEKSHSTPECTASAFNKL